MAHARRIDRPADSPFADLGEAVQFQFEGRTVAGHTHEPLAVALLGAGVRVFGRSIKFHRPRGPTCLHAHCSGCLMRVDGVPNVRTCQTLCRSGVAVERQLGWPGAERDLFRTVDWVYGQRLDHHGMFTASATVNRLAMRVVRRLAGSGEPPSSDPPAPRALQQLATDVVVVGAGAAGLAAACELAEAGLRPVVFEAEARGGGRLLDASCRIGQPEPRRGWDVLAELRQRFEAHDGIELHLGMPVVAVFQEGNRLRVVAADDRETLLVDTQRLLVCTGAYSQSRLFANNDLPGVFGWRAADRLLCGFGVIPHEPVLLAGNRAEVLLLARELTERGVRLAGVVTDRTSGELVDALRARNVTLIPDRRPFRACGSRWIDRVEFTTPESRQPDLVVDCGLLVTEAPEAPAYELGHHAGCRVEFCSDSGYALAVDDSGQTSDARVFAAGHCTGVDSAGEALSAGTRAALACALSLRENAALTERLAALGGTTGR